MRIAVVILNWNTKDYLERFLPGLLSSSSDETEIIIADSASTDGSMQMLSEKFPSVRQVLLDRNYGFTGGYNRAFEAVCSLSEAKDLQYFVLINSDIEVQEGWLEPLVRWMDNNPDCAACAPKLHSYYNRDSFEYAGAAGGLLDRFGYPFCRGRVLKKVEIDTGQYDTPADVFWATGACLMVRKEAYSSMGGLDDRFFAHMEEIDLCWRLQLEGKRICVVPESTVHHLGGGTLPNSSPWKLKLNYRNNLLMLDNNLAMTYSLVLLSEGMSPEKAAKKGLLKAGRTIFVRKVLDGCSALVYLLGGKISSFKAVIDAHKEFKALKKRLVPSDFLTSLKGHRNVKAPRLYPRWIVLLAMRKGNGIFEYLRKSL